MIRLGVLDQSPVPHGSNAATALADTVALAVETERLGYGRYWLAEHHNTDSLAGTSPEVLAASVAGATSRIRVGSGGVMLSHYSPFRVAEVFRTLDALYPGRIDLGVGRAAGTDAATEAALRYSGEAQPEEYFARRLIDLVGFLGRGFKATSRFAGVRAMPDAGVRALPDGRIGGGPELWMLASSGHGGSNAASLGLPLCFAHFITPRWSGQVVSEYRRRFSPSSVSDAPRAMLAVGVMCAPTDDEARHLAASAELWRMHPEGQERGPLLDPDTASQAMAQWSELERDLAAQHRQGVLVGDPERVTSGLAELAESHQVDELLIVTVSHDPEARRRSYRLLAEQLW